MRKPNLLLLIAFVAVAVPASPSQRQASDYLLGDAEICGVVDEWAADGRDRCRDPRREFDSGEEVCLYTRFQTPAGRHRHRVVAYRNGVEQFVRDEAGSHGDSREAEEEWWAHCEPDLALPGDWRFDLYFDTGLGYELVDSEAFQIQAERLYDFATAETCADVAIEDEGWRYDCVEPTDRFLAQEPAYLVAEFRNVIADHRLLAKTFRNGTLIHTEETGWNRVRRRLKQTYFVPVAVDTIPGTYRQEVFIDVGAGYERVADRRFVVDVLAPVEGTISMVCDWPEGDDNWAFCKHGRRGHPMRNGVALADDRSAWDANLPNFRDSGKHVFPVAPGRVVKYGGEHRPGGDETAGVLIEHTTPGGEKWWSGYLHMRRDSIRLREGQLVDIDTPLGQVGRTGANNAHLHVVVYRGKNALGGLKSFEVAFRSRNDESRVALYRKRSGDGSNRG